MADDVAIQVEHVSKDFVLPHEKITSIKSAFVSVFNMDRTKEVQHALQDVSFEVKKGEFFGVVGRNGSGKSTMLKMLANIYQPTKGNVHTYGKLVPFIELGVGFNPELTGRENVYLNGAMLGFSRKQVDAMYDDIVAFAELERFMDQKLKNYSSGMQVRLAFSMATRSEADILLVDEVLAVGDADFQRKCFEYFKALKRNKKTVVFVSHDMEAIREYCDRAVLINDSKLVATGNPEIIAQSYMKLFNNTSTGDEDAGLKGVDGNRWGNRWAVLDDVRVRLTNDKLVVLYDVIANRDIGELVYGFRIRSSDGKELLGTNAIVLKKQPLSLRAKDRVTVEWSIPNILGGGNYFVDPSLILRDGSTVCDWWNEAKKVTVENEFSTPYPVTPPTKVVVTPHSSMKR